MDISFLYELYKQSSGVSIDTRTLQRGQIFFAIKGENFNGNEYALQALENGAKYAIVDAPELEQESCFYVEDSLKALQELARFHRSQFQKPVIGITGSNGKTTTKELIALVLSSHYNVHVTAGNFNNHIGVPLTLLALNLDADIAVIEMGANHVGEIQFLCKISAPGFGIITNIGKAHLEGFGSVENIKIGKSELYRHVCKNDGVLFVNQDEKELPSLVPSGCTTYNYGSSANVSPDLQIFANKLNPSIDYSFEIKGIAAHGNSQLSGLHNFQNLKTAIAIGVYFNVPVDKITRSISEYIPENNRSQTIRTDDNLVFLDAYNANPSSMYLSAKSFLDENDGKETLMVIGDMLELGEYSQAEHQLVFDQISSMNPDQLILVGPEFKKIHAPENNRFENTDQLLDYLREQPVKNKRVFLKASRGMKFERCLEYL